MEYNDLYDKLQTNTLLLHELKISTVEIQKFLLEELNKRDAKIRELEKKINSKL